MPNPLFMGPIKPQRCSAHQRQGFLIGTVYPVNTVNPRISFHLRISPSQISPHLKIHFLQISPPLKQAPTRKFVFANRPPEAFSSIYGITVSFMPWPNDQTLFAKIWDLLAKQNVSAWPRRKTLLVKHFFACCQQKLLGKLSTNIPIKFCLSKNIFYIIFLTDRHCL